MESLVNAVTHWAFDAVLGGLIVLLGVTIAAGVLRSRHWIVPLGMLLAGVAVIALYASWADVATQAKEDIDGFVDSNEDPIADELSP